MIAYRHPLSQRLPAMMLAALLVVSMLPQPVTAAQPFVQPVAQPVAKQVMQPAVQQAAQQEPVAPDQPTTLGPNCSDPLPGAKAKLFAEDEVLISYRYRDDNTSLRTLVLDASGSNLTQRQSNYYGSVSALSSVRRLGVTAADLNGDGKAELVSTLRDKSERLAAVSNTLPFSEWYADGDAYKGDDLNWISPAAGDLDRSLHDSAAGGQEVAIAFEDDDNDIRVLVLDGQPQGLIQSGANNPLGIWIDPDDHDGRGDVSDVNTAVGDLNGDGYDDEIATAFRDGNDNLQLLVLRLNDNGSMTLLWNRSWTNHDRGDVAKDASQFRNKWPISATTGDLDGDLRDEVVIGFRSGDADDGDVQLLVVDMTREIKGSTPAGDKFEMDDRTFVTRGVSASNHWAEAATSVSVASADLDGDGRDEIALGYNTVYNYSEHDMDRYWEQHLVSYKYVGVNEPGWNRCTDDSGGGRACLEPRPGDWKSGRTKVPFAVSEDNVEALVWIATGDLDLDGKAEITLGRQNHDSGDLEVFAFDADAGLSQRTKYTVTSGSNRIEDFRLAMGDQDGDSWVGTYTGACHLRKDAQVTAVLHAPPHWPEINDEEALAAFGQSSSDGSGTGKTTETAVSASVTAKWQIKEIGPSFTHEWEKASAIETQSTKTTVEGTKFATHPPYLYPEEPYFGAIEFVETPSWCYDYTEPHIGAMTVCVPRPTQETAVLNYPLDWWYEAGRETYAESWVPVGMNLAQGRSATQSATNSGAEAGRAVDGNTNGDYNAGSVAHTTYAAHSWWQVDLGGEQWLDAVQLWNRTDCCGERLTNFYLFVSDAPFASTDPAVLLADPAVWNHHVTGAAERTATLPVNRHGRYVRVQLAGENYLQLAEVQVYGMPGAVDQWPTAQPVTTTSSFQLSWPGGLQQAVSGQLLYARKGPQLAVRAGSGAADFDLGLESEGEYVQEGSSSDKNTLGMEFRHAAGEVSLATTDKTSYILSWSKATEFSGAAGGLPRNTSATLNYGFMPYVWLQRGLSSAGINQAYLVLDYWVASIGAAGLEATAHDASAAAPTDPTVQQAAWQGEGATDTPPPAVTPLVPEVTSATHPDPNTWVLTNTATFDWAQPAGDPAVVDSYHWFLDQIPDATPAGQNLGLETTQTYTELADGVWHLHVRARDEGGLWSETGHRTIRVDANPPQVHLALDPPAATGNDDWYITPVTVEVVADDQGGSGVQAIEVSPDGVTWQPYFGPRVFDADTPGITVYARAVDAVGQWSTPITTTFKIDRTAPDSHVAGGQGPGVVTAQVITNSLGNQEMVLTGACADILSACGGMAIRYDSTDWTTADPVALNATGAAGSQPMLSWAFSGGSQIGAGNHIFYGRAQDGAGNQEEPYEIGRVLWFPQTAPDVNGSTLSASPTIVRPGEVITFSLVARNGGRQEAHVAATATLPAGLTPITDTLAADVVYDPAANTLTWPARLLWPDEWVRHTFNARAGSLGAKTTLAVAAALHAAWPNSDLLPEDQRQLFTAQERSMTAVVSVTVDPGLPAAADATPPWASLNAGPELVTTGSVPLGIAADADAVWMNLREWTLHPATGAWVVAANSGWISYSPNYTWTLSSGQGVKYLGVWVADAAGNISVLDEGSLAFVNRSDGSQTLANGQRVQYRGDLERGNWIIAVLTTLAGDPDMYIWRPRNGFRPDLYSNDTVTPGQTESLGGQMVLQSGRFLLEVLAVGDSEYNLSLSGEGQGTLTGARAAADKISPQQPTTLADPISAGQVGAGPGTQPNSVYLPEVKK